MDANIRRPLPGPVARLALKSESLQEVAQFEAVAQNLRNHVQGAFGSTAAIRGRPGERRVLAPSVTAGAHGAFPELAADRPTISLSTTAALDPRTIVRRSESRHSSPRRAQIPSARSRPKSQEILPPRKTPDTSRPS